MSQGGWYSEKAVMKDIARATGINKFDENAFVIGERPPPTRFDDDGNQLEIMYRRGSDVSETNPNESTRPDLDGITEMLRMVDTYNDINELNEETNNDNEVKNDVDNILTISKLNPDVKEFLPIASQNTTSSHKENENPNIDNPCVKDNIDKKHVNCAVQVNGHIKKETNRDEIKEKLKTKICNTSNATSVKVKHERNLAIMSLLKLYSQAPVTDTNSVQPKLLLTVDTQKQNSVLPSKDSIKLIPPNYYESLSKEMICNKPENNVKYTNMPMNENINENLPNNINNAMFENNNIDKEVVASISTNNKSTIEDAETTKKNIKNILSVDNADKELNAHDEVKESIDKVTKWLESREIEKDSLEVAPQQPNCSGNISPTTSSKVTSNNITPKKEVKKINKPSSENPSLYLGPVTFRRKGIPASNSPTLSSSDKTTEKTPSSTYVPSAYASELSKTYMERANAKREMEEDIWSKLEEELKRRDAMRAKMESNETTTSNNQNDSNLE